jgi:hypothetical protein
LDPSSTGSVGFSFYVAAGNRKLTKEIRVESHGGGTENSGKLGEMTAIGAMARRPLFSDDVRVILEDELGIGEWSCPIFTDTLKAQLLGRLVNQRLSR